MSGTDSQVLTPEEAKTLLTTAKAKHTRTVNKLEKSLKIPDISEDDVPKLKEERCLMIVALERLEAAYNDFLIANKLDETDGISTNQDKHDEVHDLYFDTVKLLKPKDNKKDQGKDKDQDKSKPAAPRMKIPDMGKFTNTIREYAPFKTKFRKYYEPYYGDHAVVILKENLLQDYPQKICASAQTVDEVFTVLDDMYGDAGKLAETVIADIEHLPQCSESLHDLRELRNAIKLGIVDLEQVNLEKHIAQYQTVSLVVRKLPPSVQRRWAELIAKEKTPTDKRFEKMMDFLDIEIRTLELIAPVNIGKNLCASARGMEHNSTQSKEYVTNEDSNALVQLIVDKVFALRVDQKKLNPSCPVHPTATHPFDKCAVMKRKSVDQQVQILESVANGYCRSCLSPHHQGNCTSDFPPNCESCNKKHFTWLHEACGILSRKDRNVHSYHLDSTKGSVECSISPAQTTQIANKPGVLNCLWDSGSNITLVLKNICEKYDLEPLHENPSILHVETVGGKLLEQKTQRYKVTLQGNQGEHSILAYAVDTIGTAGTVDLKMACDIFGVSDDERRSMTYPQGDIHLLLGADNAHLVLHHVKEVNGLRLSESVLGKVIWGKLPSASSAMTSHTCKSVTARLATVEGVVAKARLSSNDAVMDQNVRSLFSTEVMGVSCFPKCGSCACGKCVAGAEPNLQEKFELEQIKASLELKDGVIVASYPYCKDVSKLPNNYDLALRRLEQTERKLRKDTDLAARYQEQFDDMIHRGKMRLLTKQEKMEWKGPVQYLPHNAVIKPSSSSTPVRLVFDPSSKFKGQAVNDYWGRGPNLVKNALGILLRFREHSVAIIGDIAKMYQTVMTRELEWHLHRVLWRNMESIRSPDEYIVICNSFGSGPAGTVAIAAKDFIAELKREEFPRAAETIINQTYVDDILDSTKTRVEAEKLTVEIDTVLGHGGFKTKGWSIIDSATPQSSESPQSHDVMGTEGVLGLVLNKSDEFLFKIHLNFGKKSRGVRMDPDLSRDQVFDRTMVPALAKRSVLSQVHSIYDPAGFLGPFIVELKFTLGKLWRYRDDTGTELGWDDRIPEDHDKKWRLLFNTFFDLEQLRFPRPLSNSDVIGEPMLLAFSDSSMINFGAVLYIRWETVNGAYFSRLIVSKNRMWPVDPDDYLSVCRGELQGAVLASRLVQSVIRESRFSFSEVRYFTDSEIVLAQINMDSHNFSIFVGHRVAEIRSSSQPEQWWYVKSEDNSSADLLSRGTTDIRLLSSDSIWQNGPAWIRTPMEDWPITQSRNPGLPVPELRADSLTRRTLLATSSADVSQVSLTDKIYRLIQSLGEDGEELNATDVSFTLKFTEHQQGVIANLIDLKRRDNLDFMLAVTYRILHVVSWQKGDGCVFKRFLEPFVVSASQRHTAKIFWVTQAQKQLSEKLKHGHFRTLTPFKDEEGMIRCNARSKNLPGAYQPILLPNGHPFSRLVVSWFHRRGHGGATATAARVRSEYHIVQLRHLARAVRNDCQLCKLIEHRLMSVPMGSLPMSRLLPTYPFENSSCDIFGHYFVKLQGKFTRNRQLEDSCSKAYGLLFTCLSTRAIHIEVMQGQDTGAFMLALRRFICMRGAPRSVFSDCGGQIVAADQELQSMVQNLDHERLQQFGAMNSIQWQYASPGSPWQNGVSESLIKSVKTTLRSLLSADEKLYILELQTVFYEIAELLNERPINLGHQGSSGNDFEANSYLCPNQLLLGRCSTRIPAGPFEDADISHENRLLATEMVVTRWWQKWTEMYLPTLIYQSKWFKMSRLAKIGDIVHVRDLNPIRGSWNIGEVIEIKDNIDNIPRNVLIRYKTPGHTGKGKTFQTSPDRTQWRDVKNLCLIVPTEKRGLDPTTNDFVPIPRT